MKRRRRPIGGRSVGDWFVTAAGLEGQAAQAFQRMAAELRALGAPQALVQAAECAAHEEHHHRRMAEMAASRCGRKPRPMKTASRRRRSLEAFALENVSEGCVRETFGALYATGAAPDNDRRATGAIQAFVRCIAADELRHAQLSWDVHAWAVAQLDGPARRRLQRRAGRAVARLGVDLADRPVMTPAIESSEPLSPSAARLLYDGLRGELWNPAFAAS